MKNSKQSCQFGNDGLLSWIKIHVVWMSVMKKQTTQLSRKQPLCLLLPLSCQVSHLYWAKKKKTHYILLLSKIFLVFNYEVFNYQLVGTLETNEVWQNPTLKLLSLVKIKYFHMGRRTHFPGSESCH